MLAADRECPLKTPLTTSFVRSESIIRNRFCLCFDCVRDAIVAARIDG